MRKLVSNESHRLANFYSVFRHYVIQFVLLDYVHVSHVVCLQAMYRWVSCIAYNYHDLVRPDGIQKYSRETRDFKLNLRRVPYIAHGRLQFNDLVPCGSIGRMGYEMD